MSPNLEGKVCADCGTFTSEYLDIRKRSLCYTCSTRFISSKALKRMESYRFKHQVGDRRRKLLLPLSGGVSSLLLLHMLDTQLKKQAEKQNRTAYDLVLAHVSLDGDDDQVKPWRAKVQTQFPDHEFLPVFMLQDIIRYDSMAENDLKALGLTRREGEDDDSLVLRLFASARTPTARADLQELLMQRLLVTIAKVHDCESILWAHSDSRLAAKALADVAKGRGGSVSSAIADGLSPWGITFNYPIRELYKTELELYVQCQPPALSKCLLANAVDSAVPVSIRSTSIDALLMGYISSQGEKYPGIMANVVRTAGKLQVPSLDEVQHCKLCSMPTSTTDAAGSICYGCNRMKQDIIITI